ncbi:hypothetical protein GQ457_06G022220 [Hibiscus cannabinus]
MESTLQTDYILKILGLDNCANTRVGDATRRGVSGGEKKEIDNWYCMFDREMIVGPTKALFMDEISNGLDSSTSFQVVSCLQHLVHLTVATVLISLQPAPEIFELFDDVILMAEGKVVYHGHHTYICKLTSFRSYAHCKVYSCRHHRLHDLIGMKMELDLSPKLAKKVYSDDGRSYHAWCPKELPMLVRATSVQPGWPLKRMASPFLVTRILPRLLMSFKIKQNLVLVFPIY